METWCACAHHADVTLTLTLILTLTQTLTLTLTLTLTRCARVDADIALQKGSLYGHETPVLAPLVSTLLL